MENMIKNIFLVLRGPGEEVDDPGKVKIELYVVSDRGECQLLDAFYQMKKYCSQAKLLDFEILKILVITVRARTSNAISQEWTFLELKNLSSPTNFEIDP